MGYYVSIDESTARIPADKLDEAFKRLCALNHKPGVEKNGGSWGPNGQTAKWFSWMSENYDKECADANAIFQELGFETEYGEDGALELNYYDSKIGQEDLFLNEVKDLFEPESYIIWRGEDGAFWKWTPTGTKQGHVSFD